MPSCAKRHIYIHTYKFPHTYMHKLLLFSHSVMSNSFVTPRTVAHRAPLSMGFPRQEYWSGLPFPSPGDLPVPGIEPGSPALASGFFTTEPTGRPTHICSDPILKTSNKPSAGLSPLSLSLHLLFYNPTRWLH